MMQKPCMNQLKKLRELGHVIDIVQMLVLLLLNRTQCIVSLFVQAAKNPMFTIHHLCTLIGTNDFLLSLTPLGCLHYRRLPRLKITTLKFYTRDYEALITLDLPSLHINPFLLSLLSLLGILITKMHSFFVIPCLIIITIYSFIFYKFQRCRWRNKLHAECRTDRKRFGQVKKSCKYRLFNMTIL